MSLSLPANITSLFNGLKTIYNDGMKNYRSRRVWDPDMLAANDTSFNASEEVVWTDILPRVRPWTSNKRIVNLAVRGLKVFNQKYDTTLEIAREDLERFNARRISNVMEQLIEVAANWKANAIVDAFRNGGNSTDPSFIGYDGLPTFATNHPLDVGDVAKGTQANFFTARPLNEANYEFVRSAMLTYQGLDGETFGAYPDILLVPPALEMTARRIVEAAFNAAGATNVNNQTTRVVVMPELVVPGAGVNDNSRTDWYLLSSRSFNRLPLVMQVEKPMEFETSNPYQGNGMFDATFLTTEKIFMSVNGRGVAYFPAWYMAAKVRAT
jgi:phage major head subunit gpT-like protein